MTMPSLPSYPLKSNPRPCPFCGEDNDAGQLRIVSIAVIPNKAGTMYAVRCPCGAMGPKHGNQVGAVAAWDTRWEVTA